ncbi:MAG: hypothetical protein OJF49_000770 [Ktedonobacterales bacterium]|jgi:uncharacterized membrane protein|nr:MAG: hypothetical protein OJF49_000770 [Ktedonobacterales bacterium]
MKRYHPPTQSLLRLGQVAEDRPIWGLPALTVASLALLAVLAILADHAVAANLLPLPTWALDGTVDDFRTLLSTIAAASISVIALVFSSSLVVLQLASSQFGPFLLRLFMRSRITGLTLGVFVGIFLYSLFVLASLVGATFVPRIAATICLALVVISMALLLAFIYNISVSVQSPRVAAVVAGDLWRAIDDVRRRHEADGWTMGADDPQAPDIKHAIARLTTDGASVAAEQSGFIVYVDHQQLVRATERADATLRLLHQRGRFVLAGEPIANVWPSERATGALMDELAKAVVIGPERTLRQDLEFAIDRLVQISLLALSPAINNTFNALICIDWLSEGVRALAQYPCDWIIYRDGGGALRVLDQPHPITEVIEAAFNKVRQASARNTAVTTHLLTTLGRLSVWLTAEDQQAALVAQADAVVEGALVEITVEKDRAAIRASDERFREAIAHAARLPH